MSSGCAADERFFGYDVVGTDVERVCCGCEQHAGMDEVMLAKGDWVRATDVGAWIEVGCWGERYRRSVGRRC